MSFKTNTTLKRSLSSILLPDPLLGRNRSNDIIHNVPIIGRRRSNDLIVYNPPTLKRLIKSKSSPLVLLRKKMDLMIQMDNNQQLILKTVIFATIIALGTTTCVIMTLVTGGTFLFVIMPFIYYLYMDWTSYLVSEFLEYYYDNTINSIITYLTDHMNEPSVLITFEKYLY